MKNTSKTMYNIGNIFNIILLALGGLLFLIGLICAISGAVTSNKEALTAGGGLIGSGLYLFAVSIVCLIVVGNAKRELKDESTSNQKPFIMTIVFGAIADNPFYVLAGIFGLIAESQERNAQAQAQPKEEAKEEPKQIAEEENKAE